MRISAIAAAGIALALAEPAVAEPAVSVTCSQVGKAIDTPLNGVFGEGDRAFVWAGIMALAGCDSGRPEQVTTRERLEKAARLARAICMATKDDMDKCYRH